jgi:hypothetical protein
MIEIKKLLWEFLRISTPLLIIGGGISGLLAFGHRPEVPRENAATSDETPIVRTIAAERFSGAFNIEVDGVAEGAVSGSDNAGRCRFLFSRVGVRVEGGNLTV